MSQHSERDALKTKALEILAVQEEEEAYDDEYDDSFDDLAPGTRAGQEDAEDTIATGAHLQLSSFGFWQCRCSWESSTNGRRRGSVSCNAPILLCFRVDRVDIEMRTCWRTPLGCMSRIVTVAAVSDPANVCAGRSDPPPKKGKPLKPVFVKNGKIYHHRVDGAKEAATFSAAQAAVRQAKAGKAPEHGLGEGGNVAGATTALTAVARRAARQADDARRDELVADGEVPPEMPRVIRHGAAAAAALAGAGGPAMGRGRRISVGAPGQAAVPGRPVLPQGTVPGRTVAPQGRQGGLAARADGRAVAPVVPLSMFASGTRSTLQRCPVCPVSRAALPEHVPHLQSATQDGSSLAGARVRRPPTATQPSRKRRLRTAGKPSWTVMTKTRSPTLHRRRVPASRRRHRQSAWRPAPCQSPTGRGARAATAARLARAKRR